jgi:predicted NAD/FAD-binding protein
MRTKEGTNRCQVLEPGSHHVYRDMTLGQYLRAEGYSDAFRAHYVLPMCAAVWSVPNAQVCWFVTRRPTA